MCNTSDFFYDVRRLGYLFFDGSRSSKGLSYFINCCLKLHLIRFIDQSDVPIFLKAQLFEDCVFA